MVIPSNEYSASNAVSALSQILSSKVHSDRAAALKSRIKAEAGTERAADIVFEVIGRD